MNESDILKIEQTLAIKLPSKYILLVKNNPFQPFETSLLNNSSEIIKINQLYRNNGYNNKKWPNYFYIIGHYENEDLYFMNLNENNSEEVYYLEKGSKYNPKNISKLSTARSQEQFIGIITALSEVRYGKENRV